jgi:hypothetical protein
VIQLLVCAFLALVVAVAIAEYWREQIGSVRRDLADAKHENAVLCAELDACCDTRRQPARDLERERDLQRATATRAAP